MQKYTHVNIGQISKKTTIQETDSASKRGTSSFSSVTNRHILNIRHLNNITRWPLGLTAHQSLNINIEQIKKWPFGRLPDSLWISSTEQQKEGWPFGRLPDTPHSKETRLSSLGFYFLHSAALSSLLKNAQTCPKPLWPIINKTLACKGDD